MTIKVAIDLLQVPSRLHIARAEPLPAGVDLLLRIAAGDAEAENMAVASTGRSRELIRQAAIFFIEQVLFCPNSDSYRVLGANSQASNSELRRNMALLLTWLHPDKEPQEQRSVFANRVTRAWDDLKTPERRGLYDQGRRMASAQEHVRKSRGAPNAKRMLASSRRRQRHVSVARIFDSQGPLGRAWLFLLRVARH
jgi:hypothetical protein